MGEGPIRPRKKEAVNLKDRIEEIKKTSYYPPTKHWSEPGPLARKRVTAKDIEAKKAEPLSARGVKALEFAKALDIKEGLVRRAEEEGEIGQLHDALFMLHAMRGEGINVSRLVSELKKAGSDITDAHMRVLVFANAKAPHIVKRLDEGV